MDDKQAEARDGRHDRTDGRGTPPARIVFPSCSAPTLGVEMEVFLVDPRDGGLAPRADDVLARIDDGCHFKPELFRSIVEINTGVCHTVAQVRADLAAKLQRLRQAAAALGLDLFSAGTHPFSDWRDAAVGSPSRYQDLIATMRWPAQRCLIAGLHVHVGVKSGEHAVALMNALSVFIPHLLALSASSPYWQGVDTGMASSRIKTFEGMPTAGLPPQLVNWSEFVALMRTLQVAGSITSIREIWWDVRPHPGFGTVEVRICDAANTLTEVCALTALIQALVVYLSDCYDSGLPIPQLRQWTLRENKWRAARYGLQAQLIRNERGEQLPLVESIAKWVERLRPSAVSLGCAAELEAVLDIVQRGASYQRQRQWAETPGSVRDVVGCLADEFRRSAG